MEWCLHSSNHLRIKVQWLSAYHYNNELRVVEILVFIPISLNVILDHKPDLQALCFPPLCALTVMSDRPC